MNTAEKKTLTEEEYLELERTSDVKHEYYNGEIFAMSGGTANHSRISTNLGHDLLDALRGKDCDVFNGDLKVHIQAADAFVYPDVSIVCGEVNFHENNQHTILNPTVIFEVLSESTERFDRGSKFRKYQTIPSLKEYVLVDQWELQIDIFRPSSDGKWEWEGFSGLESFAHLESLGIKLLLKNVYYRVEFSSEA